MILINKKYNLTLKLCYKNVILKLYSNKNNHKVILMVFLNKLNKIIKIKKKQKVMISMN